MAYEWNAAKATANRRKHGVSFNAILDFDWSTALVVTDDSAWIYGDAAVAEALRMIGERLRLARILTIRRICIACDQFAKGWPERKGSL